MVDGCTSPRKRLPLALAEVIGLLRSTERLLEGVPPAIGVGRREPGSRSEPAGWSLIVFKDYLTTEFASARPPRIVI